MSVFVLVRFFFLLLSSPIASASLASPSLLSGYTLLSLLAPVLLLSIHYIILNSISQTRILYLRRTDHYGLFVLLFFFFSLCPCFFPLLSFFFAFFFPFFSLNLMLRPYQQRVPGKEETREALKRSFVYCNQTIQAQNHKEENERIQDVERGADSTFQCFGKST